MMRAMALLFIFHLSLITSTAQELVVTVDTVGQLATRLPDSLRFSMTELKITGPLGGNDMKLLQSILKNPRQKKPTDKVLTAIDLSEVSVQDSRGSFHTKADMLPASMFLGCKNLERVSLPADLTEVSISCFSGCVNLKEVELPETVRLIGRYAFNGCVSLKELKLPNGVVTIDKHAFDGCVSLSDIEIPETVELIDEDAFSECKALERIDLHNTALKSIKAESFARCERLESVSLPPRWCRLATRPSRAARRWRAYRCRRPSARLATVPLSSVRV